MMQMDEFIVSNHQQLMSNIEGPARARSDLNRTDSGINWGLIGAVDACRYATHIYAMDRSPFGKTLVTLQFLRKI